MPSKNHLLPTDGLFIKLYMEITDWSFDLAQMIFLHDVYWKATCTVVISET